MRFTNMRIQSWEVAVSAAVGAAGGAVTMTNAFLADAELGQDREAITKLQDLSA
jgi:hypothetical protein